MKDAASTERCRNDTTLRLTRTFSAPRDAVFRAWTDPEALKLWWIPGEGYSVHHAEVDVRVGGSYQVTMQSPDGARFRLTGSYREIRPPEKLVYTWRWEGVETNAGETLVTVEFRARGSATEVTVVHELFPDVAARDRHQRGWNACLDHLETIAR